MKTGLPLPTEMRLAIVRAFHEQHFSYEEIAELLGIGEASVSRVLRLHRETQSVEPRPRGGGNFSPVSGAVADRLKALVAETPDATVQELMEKLVDETGVETSLAAMKRAMHRLGFSRKKRSSLPPSGTRRRTSGAGASSPRS